MDDKIAVVAGATRGAGRGIARALGEAGALVYCTGRSVRGNPSPYRRPETIEETAEMITQAGGRAIAVRVDHTVEAEVEDLFARIHREHGRVDVLVNSIAGEDPMMRQFGWFWEADLKNGEAGFRQALLSHIITAKHAARLMVQQRSGLIVEVTESDVLMAGGNPLTQAVKLALKGFVLEMAAELKSYGVAAIAITPGFLRSESMLEHFGSLKRIGRKQERKTKTSSNPRRRCSLAVPSRRWPRTAGFSNEPVNSAAPGSLLASMVSLMPMAAAPTGEIRISTFPCSQRLSWITTEPAARFSSTG